MAGDTFVWRCPSCEKAYKIKAGKTPPEVCPTCAEVTRIREFNEAVNAPVVVPPFVTERTIRDTWWDKTKRFWDRLQKERTKRIRAEREAAAKAYAVGGYQIICPNPNCGFKGRAKQEAKGSEALGCFLMLFFLLPGIIYLMFASGYRYRCPKCGMQVASD